VDDLAREGLIKPDSVQPYARGSLVLAVHRDLAGEVRSLTDLAKPAVKKIALANPETAPYGKAGKQALERAGLFNQLQPKIVQAESVAQAMLYAQRGDAEAALIGRAIAQGDEIQVVEIDAQLYDAIIQALGVVSATKRPDEAGAFARFVLGEDGKSILRKFGFTPAGGATSEQDTNESQSNAPLWLSLRVASLATLLIVILGMPTALVLARARFPGKALVAGILVLPLVLPPTVIGFYLLQCLGRRSPLGHWLEHSLGITLVFHWSGAVVASAVAAFPLFLLPARGAFEAIDPGLEDVARLLGRGEFSVFWSVTLPLARRGLAAGAVLAFARALGDFGATLMVAGNIPGLTQTAALAIYDAVQVNDNHRAGWLTLWVSLVSILALVAVQRGLPGRGLIR
jgi:molybdate transport system permease protein